MISGFWLTMMKAFENRILVSYLDSAGKPTIGYGHLILPHEEFSGGITAEFAEQLLLDDLAEAERGLIHALDGRVVLSAHQREALVSFVFNFGVEKAGDSTLFSYVKLGELRLAAWEFEKWCHVRDPETGALVVNEGLLRRRFTEQAHFLGGSQALVKRVWEGVR